MDPLKTSPSSLDEDFVRAIKTGGPQGEKAIMDVYACYHKRIRSFIRQLRYRNGDHQSEPDDILHDSFIVVLQKIQYENAHITSIRAFWSGIAKNMWLNDIKKHKKIKHLDEPEEKYGSAQDSPEHLIMEKEKFRRIETCMGKCGGRCQELLLLWLADYTMDEIAERLNLSGPAMARKIKHECFKKLKKMVADSNILTL